MPYVNPYPQGVYLDNNASMPLLPSVREALCRALDSAHDLANPSSIHRPGQRAKEILYQCKKELCEWLGTRDSEEWVFVSGATEAINSVLSTFEGKAVAFSNVDHAAIYDNLVKKTQNTFELKVNSAGQLCEKSIAALEEFLSKQETCLLNWQLTNNETGITFQLSVLEALVRKHNQRKQKIFVLMDAAQALGKLDEAFIRRAMHLADYFVVSAHKIGGPTGMGALWMREGIPFSPLLSGGKQEKSRRAGTHNTLGIVGFAAAVKDWRKNSEKYRAHLQSLKELAYSKLSQVEGFTLHGDHNQNSLCNTLNFHFASCKDESLLLAMDLENFYLSSGSACNSGSLKASRVLASMGYSEDAALSSLRLCVGPQNTAQELEIFCERLAHRVAHIKAGRSKWKELLPEMKDEPRV